MDRKQKLISTIETIEQAQASLEEAVKLLQDAAATLKDQGAQQLIVNKIRGFMGGAWEVDPKDQPQMDIEQWKAGIFDQLEEMEDNEQQ